jgi:hypothetical protein
MIPKEKVLVTLCLLCTAAWCIPLVSADEIYPTITYVFFEQDHLPFHEPVSFTMNCYGIACKMWDCSGPDDQGNPADYRTNLAYSFHASCPDYGCMIHEPYYHTERLKIDHCDIEGTAGTVPFKLEKFSKTPMPNCTDLHQYSICGGQGLYYNTTPEYDQCILENRQRRDRCNRYLEICDRENDLSCADREIDGKYWNETRAYRTCRETVMNERDDCDRFLRKINPATMIMWKYQGYSEDPAIRACDLRFSLPPKNQTSGTLPVVTETRPVLQSPVESFYCSILDFFGRRCE